MGYPRPASIVVMWLGTLGQIACGMDISAVASSFASTAASAISATLPNKYSFAHGYTGTYIADGGNDMYDHGNTINVMSTSGASYSLLPYTQKTSATAAGGDITYLTYRWGNVWLAAFSSPSNSLGTYFTSGNNGADGGGSQAYGYLGQSSVTSSYKGWYKKVYNAGADPSINELIITTDSSWVHSIGSSTDNGEHRLQKGNCGVSEIYYIMWAGTSGYDYSTSYFTNVMNTFLQKVYTGDFLSPVLSESFLKQKMASARLAWGAVVAWHPPEGQPSEASTASAEYYRGC
ncbi:hypothetical protein CYMTET_31862 [Cymbomonas tetramitiformis]|uniref:Uncharacterized protein n=1 Tax=Cymbomonas tetramitiformis TaxID=36881 RepID=A0AAE0KSR9_9CHLO|nr:hypothetical protein CYMTET_31862 [Cymbomonas tetramitiformis]